MFLLYNLLFFLGFVLLSPYYLWRMCRRGGYAKDFGQRFACYKPAVRAALAKGNAIWIHSVSVGEKNAVALVIQRLRERFPESPVVWSTTTSTGYAGIQEFESQGITRIYYPLDFPPIVRRALALIRPRALILVESEIWPNMIRILSRRNIPVALINARISRRSHRRYLKLGRLARETFGQLRLVAAQEPEHVERLAALGVAKERIHPVGSLKFDAAIPKPGAAKFDPWEVLAPLGVRRDQPILFGGSTWPGEERVLFDLLHELKPEFPGLFLVVVPRHFERAKEIVQEAKQKQVKFVLRTEMEAGRGAKAPPPLNDKTECLIVNTTGELSTFYEVATAVFVGKSLFEKEKSLQNPIEPAALGKAVIVGPHIESFEAIVQKFLMADAMIQVRDAAELKSEVRRLLREPDHRNRLGRSAQRVVEQNRGAVERTVRLLEGLIQATNNK